MKNNKILSLPSIGRVKKSAPKKRVSGVKKGIGSDGNKRYASYYGHTIMRLVDDNGYTIKTFVNKIPNEPSGRPARKQDYLEVKDTEDAFAVIDKGFISGVKKGIGGSLFQKFQDVAKETKFTLRGAKLGTFLKWMNRNSKEIFGRSITTLKWFTVLDKYPQVMDAMASARIDTEPLEDEDEAKVERYYASVKKKKMTK